MIGIIAVWLNGRIFCKSTQLGRSGTWLAFQNKIRNMFGVTMCNTISLQTVAFHFACEVMFTILSW